MPALTPVHDRPVLGKERPVNSSRPLFKASKRSKINRGELGLLTLRQKGRYCRPKINKGWCKNVLTVSASLSVLGSAFAETAPARAILSSSLRRKKRSEPYLRWR